LGLCSNKVHGPHGVGLWRILGRAGGSCQATLDLRWGMDSMLVFDMMFGCGAQTIKTSFLDLLSITRFKDVVVVDHLELSGAFHQWNINFLRAAHDWEMDHLISLFNLLYSVRVRWGGDDRLWLDSFQESVV
jgi:hypothetical protein